LLTDYAYKRDVRCKRQAQKKDKREVVCKVRVLAPFQIQKKNMNTRQKSALTLIVSGIAMFILLAIVDVPHPSDKFIGVFIGLSAITFGIIGITDKSNC
jgi:hypothetical protein